MVEKKALELKVFDRKAKIIFSEKIYGEKSLLWLYKKSFLSKCLCHLFSSFPFFSFIYGLWAKSSFSKKKILPFIQKFSIDTSEFERPVEKFTSFNDFFIRQLKPTARPISSQDAILPADARYLAFSTLKEVKNFFVKDQKFDLESFLKEPVFAEKYASGSMVIARLAPVDCHRFYFPFDCSPQKSKLINGCLYSVNPLALKQSFSNFLQNKRILTVLKTEKFKDVLMVEVGAMNVGSIIQTCLEKTKCQKGAEKGYFALGGSSIVLFFEENTIKFDQDLIDNSLKGIETYGQFGDSLGTCF